MIHNVPDVPTTENPFAGTENQTINFVDLAEQKYKIVQFGQKKARGSSAPRAFCDYRANSASMAMLSDSIRAFAFLICSNLPIGLLRKNKSELSSIT